MQSNFRIDTKLSNKTKFPTKTQFLKQKCETVTKISQNVIMSCIFLGQMSTCRMYFGPSKSAIMHIHHFKKKKIKTHFTLFGVSGWFQPNKMWSKTASFNFPMLFSSWYIQILFHVHIHNFHIHRVKGLWQQA